MAEAESTTRAIRPLRTYLVHLRDDGGSDMSRAIEVDAGTESEQDAAAWDLAADEAREWAMEGDWGTDGCFVEVSYYLEDDEYTWQDRERSVTVTIDPAEPDCADDEDHDWQSPEWLGGCGENPGVFGHGGGVIIREVCSHCGKYRITDTWAQNPSNGEQGLTSTSYEDADERSAEWAQEMTEGAQG